MAELKNCLLTGIPLIGEVKYTIRKGSELYYYFIKVKETEIAVTICRQLYDDLLWDESELSKMVRANKRLLIGEFAKDDFKWLNGKVFHSECNIEGQSNNYRLKDFIDNIKSKQDYPKDRIEKYYKLLSHLHRDQAFDGAEVSVHQTIDFYGKFYLKSFAELQFFLNDMQDKKLIKYDETKETVQFTFAGLHFIDGIKDPKKSSSGTSSDARIDVALSFAGEDREYVEKVAKKLRELGVSVFYDAYEQANLWGKDLYQHLNDVYKDRCQYCIIFISKHYAEKVWTKHELKSAQARAFNENREYILPARFDSTEVPGINPTVGYLDCSKLSPEEIASRAAEKLRQK